MSHPTYLSRRADVKRRRKRDLLEFDDDVIIKMASIIENFLDTTYFANLQPAIFKKKMAEIPLNVSKEERVNGLLTACAEAMVLGNLQFNIEKAQRGLL